MLRKQQDEEQLYMKLNLKKKWKKKKLVEGNAFTGALL